MPLYLIRECTAPACRFRFPAAEGDRRGERCPRCGIGRTAVVARPAPSPAPPPFSAPAALHLELLLDNIRSVYNVGALFRTADGAGVQHMHLSGITAPPDHPKLAKTALGAEQMLPWTAHNNAVAAAKTLKARGWALWGLEEHERAEDLFRHGRPAGIKKAVLIIGNEKVGIDPAVIALCDRVFTLPMLGGKKSLNVAVAAGIALYQLRFGGAIDPVT
jgi:tRNA G18 (ribose-2'-O)-methylase SpoU